MDDYEGAPIRRLPVYFLLDCSSSMKGNAIEAVKNGVRNVMAKLAQEPMTLDIVWSSVIAFDSSPRQILPLTPIHHITGFPVSVGGASNLGKAIRFLKDRVANRSPAPDRKDNGGLETHGIADDRRMADR